MELPPVALSLQLTGSTIVSFVLVAMIVTSVGVHDGACDIFGSGCHNHLVPTLVSA